MNKQKDIYYLQCRENGFPMYTYYRDMGMGYDLVMDSDEVDPYKEVKDLKIIKEHISSEVKNNKVDIYTDVLVKKSFDNINDNFLALPERGCIVETNNEFIITDSIDFYKNDLFKSLDKDIDRFLRGEKRRNHKKRTIGNFKPLIYGLAVATSLFINAKNNVEAETQSNIVAPIETEIDNDSLKVNDEAFMNIPEEVKISLEEYDNINSSNIDDIPEPLIIDNELDLAPPIVENEPVQENVVDMSNPNVYISTQGVNVPYCSILESEYYAPGVLRNISVTYEVDDVERKMIEAIVASEDNHSYEGALAVISTAINRMYDTEWRGYGDTILQQFKAINQYSGYQYGSYKPYFDGRKEIPPYVTAAVTDALNGLVNTSCCSFNAPETGRDGVRIGQKGNIYFDPMNTYVEATYLDDGRISQYDSYRDEYLGKDYPPMMR